jgi:AAA ATPase domain
VFVGRGRELARVGELLQRARQGQAGGVFVLGEAGVGKTRLLDEAARIGAERGLRVARASCLPPTTVLPLDPALQLVRALCEPVASGSGGPLQELFWTVVERLEQASVEGPVLLCLDDLQWSDAATVDLVQYCLARLSDLPIAWLLASRLGRAQAQLAHRVQHDGRIDRLQLGALGCSSAHCRRSRRGGSRARCSTAMRWMTGCSRRCMNGPAATPSFVWSCCRPYRAPASPPACRALRRQGASTGRCPQV